MSLKVQLSTGTSELLVLLNSNLSGEWADYPFQKTGEQEYSLELQCKQPGAYHAKVKYSQTQGTTWHFDNIPHSSIMIDPVESKQLRLYTLIPTISGHINHWIEALHRIKKMGFNAVHLLPVTAMDTSESPYAAADLFDIDQSYAIPDDPRPLLEQFESFVKEAKELGIKLCFDVVLNHVGVTSKISVNCPDWIASDSNEPDGLKRAGCWNQMNWVTWQDLVLVKYDHPSKSIRREIWDYMLHYLLFWAKYAHYTGGMIRLDNLHSTNRDFLDFAISKMRSELPNLTIFAELFTDRQTTQRMVFFHELNLLLATPWTHPYAEQFRQQLSSIHSVTKVRFLLPVTSHDSGSPAQEYGSPKAAVSRYAACALLGGGHTGFVQGAEFGVPQKLSFIGRSPLVEMQATTWGHDYSEQIRALNEFLENFELFSQTGNIQFIDNNHSAVLAAIRYGKDLKPCFLVLISFDAQTTQTISISFGGSVLKNRTLLLRNCFSQAQPPSLLDSVYSFTLDPCEVKVFEIESVIDETKLEQTLRK